MPNTDFDCIVFHSPCSDGDSSLWCANYFKEIKQKIPCRAGIDPTGDFTNKSVLFTDICPSFEYIVEITKKAKFVLILDHHKSSYDMYQENILELVKIKKLKFVFDMNRSGCQITWDYFFPNKERPWFIDYIGDRDLWQFKLPHSKEINAVFFEHNLIDRYDFSKLTNLLNDSEEKKNNFITEGKIILQIQKRELDSATKKAVEATFTIKNKKYRVWLGGNTTSSLRSDLGNNLTKKKFSDDTLPDFVAIWLYEPKLNEWWISLRGSVNGPDLSVISKYYGGGGHPQASGFTIKNGNSLKDFFTVIQ